jgi:hypothetical protein
MDYAFAPGLSDYEDLLRGLFNLRPNTTLVSNSGLTSIADFLNELKSQSFKADNLVVGGHANDDRWAVRFDSVTPVPKGSSGIDYEMLQAVQSAKTINIPAGIRTNGIKFHIKGCEIGSKTAQPFLDLLKKALDNPQQITAPKFLHALSPDPHDAHTDKMRGVFEYMKYDFTVYSPTPVANTPTLVQMFQDQHFQTGVETGGTPVEVPADNWKRWVLYGLNLAPVNSHEVVFDSYSRIDPPITSGGVKLTHLKADASCMAVVERLPGVLIPLNGTPIPGDKPGQLALAKSRLKLSATMAHDHPFPSYVRYGFKDFESMWNGMDWTVDPQGGDLLLSGQHYAYKVRIPVTKAGSDKLIFNFYPKTGTPTINFVEDNAKFELFGTV